MGPSDDDPNVRQPLFTTRPFHKNHQYLCPTMAPLPPLLSDANDSWEAFKNAMDWFSKIVTTAYESSDAISAERQHGVDMAYKKKKAEKEAKEIQRDQVNANVGESKGVTKRELFWDDGEERFLEGLDE